MATSEGSHNRQKNFLAGKLSKYIFSKFCRVKNVDPYIKFSKMASDQFDGSGNVVEKESKVKSTEMQEESDKLFEASV